ncbi:hypothetical protein PRIPAC_80956 [Pristionchus pacificus]|uniref:Uncharacterized protein n=1 Tax=Pristionchus pacificus TaxID=54126 RepID=A0A2A6CLN2_PRIPA|nr:hypothetical protein PRIPAC_80956 [Pristionchus pacificus]|eukprot:PDM79010.1 hypothetical protein PRIPAC_31589 [Pristionchus pacificus]
MLSFRPLIIATLVVGAISYKMTPEIESCMAQIESQVGGETEASLKTAIEGVLAGVKTSNLLAAQKVFKEVAVPERNRTLDKYMVNSCSQMKTCFICPLELA